MDKKDIEAIFQMSYQQKGMLLETLSASESGIHIEQIVWEFLGELNLAFFKQAWQCAINHHAMLRTVFVWKNRSEPVQVVLRSAQISFAQHNLSDLSSTEQETRIAEHLRADRQKGFDLSRAPLMRLSLFQTGESAYQMMWTYHHILMDGWCYQLVIQDVLALYRGLVAGQEIQLAPSRPYQAYIAWLKQQNMLSAEKFWREMLQGVTEPTLPGSLGDVECCAEMGEHYAVEQLGLSAVDTQALTALSQKRHVTINTLLQGMWALLLSRYSGNDDIIFGATVSGRPSNLAGSETMIGLFINTLPLRIRVHPNDLLWPWLNEIQTMNLDLRNYEYCSEGQVHQWSNMPASRPLFESIQVFQNYPVNTPLSNAGDVRQNQHVGAQAKYALTLLVNPGVELGLRLVWDKRRFCCDEVKKILEHACALLKSFITDEEVPLSALLESIPADQIPHIRPLSASAPSENQASFEAPRTSTEKALTSLFAKYFEVGQIGREENFLGKGGTSLAALQLVYRVQETFHVEIPLQAAFETPTIAEFARRIEEAQAAASFSSMPLLARDEKLPLSVTQQAIWGMIRPDQPAAPLGVAAPGLLKGLLAGRKTGSVGATPRLRIHPIVASVHIAGDLHQDALVASLKRLRQRHELLRVRFAVQDGHVFQTIDEDAADSGLQIVEGVDLDAQNLIRQETQRSFDLEAGSLWRVTLCRLAGQSHLLVLTLHPLIADTPSAKLLVRDLIELYQGVLSGKPSLLPELSIQYADYAAWQQNSLSKDALSNQLEYWKQHLRGYKPLFPAKRPQTGEAQPILSVFSPTFVLAQKQVEALKALSQQQKLPWILTLAATFQLLLYRCTNEEDIAVAVSIPNRSQKAVENVVGPFANHLILRMVFTGETGFLDVLQQLRATATASLINQDVPFETVTKELPPNLIQVMFALDDKTRDLAQPLDGAFSDLRVIGSETNFELCLLLKQDNTGLSGQIAYNPDLFDRVSIERFVQDYQTLVENIFPHEST